MTGFCRSFCVTLARIAHDQHEKAMKQNRLVRTVQDNGVSKKSSRNVGRRISLPAAPLIRLHPRAFDLEDQWPLLAVVAVGLPAAFAFFERLALDSLQQRHWPSDIVALILLLSVIRTAVLGTVVRPINQPVIRWIPFGWSLIALNLMLITVQTPSNYSTQPTFSRALTLALTSSQISLLAMWTVLGNTDWRQRAPLAATATAMMFIIGVWTFGSSSFLPFLICLYIGTAVLSAGMRCTAFRLQRSSSNPLFISKAVNSLRSPIPAERSQGTTGRRVGRFQFSLAHLLICTTAFAGIMAIFRSTQWASILVGPLQLVCLVSALSAITVFSCWAVLSDDPLFVRVTLMVATTLHVGVTFGFLFQIPSWHSILPIEIPINEAFKIWIGWAIMSSAFNAAVLVAFRVSGNRLVRSGGGSLHWWLGLILVKPNSDESPECERR